MHFNGVVRLLIMLSFAALATLQSCSCTECVADTDCADGQTCGSDGSCADDVCAACVANQLCDDNGCVEDCEADFMWDGEACVGLDGCNACVVDNRECLSELTGECGDCVAGYDEDAAGSCVPSGNCDPPPAEGTLVEVCAAEGRACEVIADGADCGDCLDGYLAVGDACEEEFLCADGKAAECQDEFRTCSDEPNGTCGDCLAGYLPITDDDPSDGCRAIQTCADLSCDTLCNEATDTADAFCTEACTGPGGNQGIEDATGFCVECGSCDGPGEDGPYLLSLYAGTTCVCRSDPGFYYDPALNATQPCDEDGDGWARKSAQLAYESPDAVLQATFACNIREVSAFELRSWDGDSLTVAQDPPAPLFEEDRNDSQALLNNAALTPYGGRALKANELNGLTKYCVGSGGKADYNANGVPDVDEHQGMTLPGGESIHTPFIAYTFFGELHRGWFDNGTYIIEEKSRDAGASPDLQVPMNLPEDGSGDDTYWRQCVVLVDADYDVVTASGIEPVTMDFASFAEPDPWSGEMVKEGFIMAHHSQFKCMRVVADATPTSPRHYITVGQLQTAVANDELELQTCAAQGTDAAPDQFIPAIDPNPRQPEVTCLPGADPAGLPLDSVRWTVVEYRHPNTSDAYTLGCVNECSAFKPTCDGYDPAHPDIAKCEGIASNYGQLTCGCATNFGGPACDVPCPGFDPRQMPANAAGLYNHLFVEEAYTVAPRTGYWMCGSLATTDTPVLSDGQAGGYTLRGEVPAIATPQEPLTGTDANGLPLVLSGYVAP